MAAYYNEIDPFAVQWLRNLIAAGLIADGEVDERSIKDVDSNDIKGFTQVHFFAGLGGWSLALRLAGWPDNRSVGTGSCPCQPFSGAGKKKGTKDPRHLWPDMRRLVEDSEIAVWFGEQVASKDGRQWLAGVRADMEALGFGFGAADLCAAGVGEKNHPLVREAQSWAREMADVADRNGNADLAERFRDFAVYIDQIIVGAPHIRQRLWWVADNGNSERERWASAGSRSRESIHAANRNCVDTLPNSASRGCSSGSGPAIESRKEGREHERGEGSKLHRQLSNGSEGCSNDFDGIPNSGQQSSRFDESRQMPQTGDEPSERGREAGGKSGRCGQSCGIPNPNISLERRLESTGQQPINERDCGNGVLGNSNEPRANIRTVGSSSWDAARESGSTVAQGDPANVQREERRGDGPLDAHKGLAAELASPWSDFGIVNCLDGKARRVGRSVQPLVNGIPRKLGPGKPRLQRLAANARSNRIGRLRGYGNAIVPELAAIFIQSYMELELS